MADTTRLPQGIWIEGSLAIARPVGAIVRNTVDGGLYASTDPVTPTYVQLTNVVGVATVVSTASDPYAVPAGVEYVLLTGTGQTVHLPAGSDGRVVTIKDKAGTATLNPITVNPAGAETIDGAASLSLDNDYVAVTLAFLGTEWSIT